MRTALVALVLVVGGLAVAQVVLARAFGDRAARLTEAVLGQPLGAPRDDLPAMVRDFALRNGATGDVQAIRFTQEARLRRSPGGPFTPYEAAQAVAVGASAFAWDARQRVGPLTVVRVIDAYVDGEGLLEARVLSSVPVARASGPDTTLGEALRYLGELAWAPDAILANPAIAWTMTGEREVEAAIETPAGRAAVTFAFDGAGDIVGMEARDRPARAADGTVTRLDWRGRFADYRQVGPRRIPVHGEVGYAYPEGFSNYFEGSVLTYELVE